MSILSCIMNSIKMNFKSPGNLVLFIQDFQIVLIEKDSIKSLFIPKIRQKLASSLFETGVFLNMGHSFLL